MEGDGCDILLLTAGFGRGHRQVAAALEEALWALRSGLRIRTTDERAILGRGLSRLVLGAYAFMLCHWQAGMDWLYRSTDRLDPGSWLHRQLHGFGRWRLLRVLRRCWPRVVVCTFPDQAGALSELRRRGLWSGPAVVVITDQAAHSQWVHPYIDAYCAPSVPVAEALAARGCDRARITVTGIPLRRAFAEAVAPAEVRAALGLLPSAPTVLITAGPLGQVAAAVQACRAVCGLPLRPQVLLVAGSARAARRATRALGRDAGVRVLGFVRNMARLFSVADVFIGKAGGVTTAEALAAGVPMLLFRSLPAQERQNAVFLAGAGAACVVEDPAQLAAEIGRLLSDMRALSGMRAAALRLGAPRAAEAAAERILRFLDGDGAVEPRPPQPASEGRQRAAPRAVAALQHAGVGVEQA